MSDSAATTPALDAASLTDLARTVTARPELALVEWHLDLLHGGATTNAAIYRVVLSGEDAGQPVRCALILKIWRRLPERDEPARWRYWKREAEAYRSGLLADLPPGLHAPRCYAVDERPDAVWLWLEDMGRPPERWTPALFARAAYDLGRLNGAYLAAAALPDAPWLSRGWLREWVEFCGGALAELPAVREHPLVRPHYGPELAAALEALWSGRASLLDAVDRLPQTLCHRDGFARNLFPGAAAAPTVAIDWATVGIGAVGEDLAALVGGSLAFFELRAADAEQIEPELFAAYVDGLRAAGWQGDARLARLGYTATLALRYGLGGALDLGIVAEPDLHAWAELVLGHTVAELVPHTAATGALCMERAAEARRLVAECYGPT